MTQGAKVHRSQALKPFYSSRNPLNASLTLKQLLLVILFLLVIFRMNELIMRWPSGVFYNGKLEAAPSVANQRLEDLGGCLIDKQAERLRSRESKADQIAHMPYG